MEWTGTYNDPIYGGLINVCVSLVDGVYIGQGFFSEIGYMRGPIDGTNIWTGNFWSAGYEIKQGTYSLQLTVDTETTFSGTFHENPSIIYTINSTQISAVEPSDLACFRSDDAYLTSEPLSFNYNGSYSGYTFQYNYVANNQLIGSYGRDVVDDKFQSLFGLNDHNPLYVNGQITAGNWYETNGAVGIELYVVKNVTAFYCSWWDLPRVSALNFSTDIVTCAHEIEILYQADPLPNWESAVQNSCFMLPSETLENLCWDGVAAASEGDSDSWSTNQITYFSCTVVASLVVGVVIGWFVTRKCSNKPNDNGMRKSLMENAVGN